MCASRPAYFRYSGDQQIGMSMPFRPCSSTPICTDTPEINLAKTQLACPRRPTNLPRIYPAGISNRLVCALIPVMVPQMSSDDSRRVRTWQEIAAEASREKDPKKLMELTHELERALEERDAKLGLGHKSASARD